ncbi:MAG: 4'-phosphopantetheinyl transferase superfamily protein [bacterium]|nr:4'-phosphopantetheinyl transferase superfamily protein [bacterium]
MAIFNGEWLPGPEIPVLQDGTVHVWRFPLALSEEDVAGLRARLSKDEITRADRFVFPEHRRRFTVARGVLRTVLARYLAVDPAEMCFEYGSHGKPFLAGHDLHFNLSHSGGLGLLALVRGQRIGADVEQIREKVRHEQIANRFFSSGEVEALGRLPQPQRVVAFFTCWTRKEAYIKAIGEGLSCPLDRFDVSVVPGEPAELLCVRGDPGATTQWTMRALDLGPGYVGAVVVEGKVCKLQSWQWI